MLGSKIKSFSQKPLFLKNINFKYALTNLLILKSTEKKIG
ncbi:hypothetical protein AsAng_0011130 [Aureispira anguillae]|uniref:Uncharacterized protein n=1 Tax=Aureispira anguillae TaxID=2864201 RepID=A0A916DR21_9BACT|nr:hypothetical protein AsAng_0011130 [Aureispira anguillae]